MNRRQFLGASACLPYLEGQRRRSSNFVVITIDDLGYADIGPYNPEVNYTPNLDRMAREGRKLTSFYAAPLCTPSRAALMTGCYPKRVGLERGSWHGVLFPGDIHGLHPDEITVARLLKNRGYATACVGKWHLGDQPEFLPTSHGFDSYFGIPFSNDMRPEQQIIRGADHPPPPLPLVRDTKVVREVTDQAFLTEAYTEEAVKFIEANRNRPFFLYLAHSAVHAPLFAGVKFQGKTGKGLYADSVAECDWSVGRILETLIRLKVANDTFVLFTSDNGGTPRASNKPLRGNKGSTWEGGVRTPAIVWWPGRIDPGEASGEIASNMDVLPTLARLAGSEPPNDRVIDGKDLSPVLFGKPGTRSGYRAFYYYAGPDLRAVRSSRWKLHTNGELYDLEADPGESHNVGSAHAKEVQRLQALLEDARKDLGDGPLAGANVRPAGKAKTAPRFFIPRPASTGLAPHEPIKKI